MERGEYLGRVAELLKDDPGELVESPDHPEWGTLDAKAMARKIAPWITEASVIHAAQNSRRVRGVRLVLAGEPWEEPERVIKGRKPKAVTRIDRHGKPFGFVYPDSPAAAQAFGVCRASICTAINSGGKCAGFRWAYVKTVSVGTQRATFDGRN